MKKTVSLFVCIVMVFAMLVSLNACGSSIQDDWSSVIIGENLPTPQKGKLKSGSNLDNGFFGGIEKVDADYYEEYKKACIERGYTIDSEEREHRYEAFNTDGYDLSLYFHDDEISITLVAPEVLSEFAWPTTGIGAKLPAPVSTLGKVTSDSSDCFRATIGNTTIDDFNDYVKSCEQKGFVIDYTKQDGGYEAKNSEGYRLNTSYLGCNRIDIMIQTPKKESTTSTAETTSTTEETTSAMEETTSTTEETTSTTEETTSTNEESSKEELGKDFKDSMDSYEEFMNEYVSFMKKYNENPSDISLLSDYATYLTKYADFVKDFEKWEKEELNTTEIAYYIDVQARVSKKLLEVVQ